MQSVREKKRLWLAMAFMVFLLALALAIRCTQWPKGGGEPAVSSEIEIEASSADNGLPPIEPDGSDALESVGDSTPEPEPIAEIPLVGEPVVTDSELLVGDRCFEFYNYVESRAEQYAEILNRSAQAMRETATVYALIAPTSIGITLPDELFGLYNTSDQQQSIETMYAKMSADIHTVSVYQELMRHRAEYVYFRTDHHWTALGAYYSYTIFCAEKGIEPVPLEQFETMQFDGFLGSFYTDTGSEAMAANPDSVVVFCPPETASMHIYAANGEFDWPVIYDATSYRADYKYLTFIGGDNPLTTITNSAITDGSSCVVVKESYGNAFVPFLINHYQTVYVIDYRYWTGSLTQFVAENAVQDVLFLNNISATRSQYLLGKLNEIA